MSLDVCVSHSLLVRNEFSLRYITNHGHGIINKNYIIRRAHRFFGFCSFLCFIHSTIELELYGQQTATMGIAFGSSREIYLSFGGLSSTRCTRTSHNEEQNERDYLTGHFASVSPDVDRYNPLERLNEYFSAFIFAHRHFYSYFSAYLYSDSMCFRFFL